MGFRVPLSTASAVDTNAGGAGVSIREVDSGAGPVGVVEFRSGVPGSSPATLQLSAFTANGALTDAAFTLVGPGAPGVTPGEVILESLPNAPTRARIVADSISLEGQGGGGLSRPLTVTTQANIAGPDAAYTALPLLPGWVAWDASKNTPRTWRDAAGTVHVRGIVKIDTGASLGAGVNGVPCTALPFPSRAQDVHGTAVLLTPSGTWYGAGWTFVSGGTLTIPNNAGAALGAGYGWALQLSWPT